MGEARKEQSIVEGKIAELENTLARAEVVDASKFSGDMKYVIVRLCAGFSVKSSDIENLKIFFKKQVVFGVKQYLAKIFAFSSK